MENSSLVAIYKKYYRKHEVMTEFGIQSWFTKVQSCKEDKDYDFIIS